MKFLIPSAVLFNLFYLVGVADLTSLNLGAGSVRWAWMALPLMCIRLPKGGEPKIVFILTLLFFAVHLIAALLSEWVLKGLLYSSWIIFNYAFFFRAGYLLANELQEHIWSAFLWGGRLQIVAAVALVLCGIHDRAQFIYFEPSYLAVGLVPYLFAAMLWSRIKWLDCFLLLALIAFNQSANMLMAISIAVLFWLITNGRIWISLGLAFLLIFIGYIFYLITLGDTSSPNHGVAVWISENGISIELTKAILARAGNRIPRMLAALEMLDGHWLIGFGPSVYLENTANLNFDHLTDGVDYLDPAGLPVINVLLESITNAGLLAAILLSIIFLYVLYISITRVDDVREKRMIVGALLAFGLMLQFESSYLRAYVWISFGVFVARALRRESTN